MSSTSSSKALFALSALRFVDSPLTLRLQDPLARRRTYRGTYQDFSVVYRRGRYVVYDLVELQHKHRPGQGRFGVGYSAPRPNARDAPLASFRTPGAALKFMSAEGRWVPTRVYGGSVGGIVQGAAGGAVATGGPVQLVRTARGSSQRANNTRHAAATRIQRAFAAYRARVARR